MLRVMHTDERLRDARGKNKEPDVGVGPGNPESRNELKITSTSTAATYECQTYL